MKILKGIVKIFLRFWWIPVFVFLMLFPVLFVWLIVKWNCIEKPSDYIQIGCTILTYITTIVFSGLAVSQNRKAHELSQLVYRQSERAYFPSFAVQSVTYKSVSNCKGNHFPIMHFCQIDNTPERCESFEVTITNCSEYPITDIQLAYIYKVGKKQTREVSTANLDAIIAPGKDFTFGVCDTPRLLANGMDHTFQITCSNTFGYSSTIALEISSSSKGETQPIKFRCKAIMKEI